MYGKMKEHLSNALAEIKEAGLYKEERIIESPQSAAIEVKGKEVLNFCANNYLGLSNHPRLIEGAKKMMDKRGFGMSSVRFICGTQDSHKELEAAISDYFKTEDTILYAACFDRRMVESSNHCSPIKMLLSPTPSTTPLLLTVYVFVRRSVIVMQMPTWPTLSVVYKRHRNSVSASS